MIRTGTGSAAWPSAGKGEANVGGGRAPPPASLAKVWASRCPWRAGLVSPAAEREPHVCPEAAVGCLPPADPAPSLSFLICQAWGKRFLLGRALAGVG